MEVELFNHHTKAEFASALNSCKPAIYLYVVRTFQECKKFMDFILKEKNMIDGFFSTVKNKNYEQDIKDLWFDEVDSLLNDLCGSDIAPNPLDIYTYSILFAYEILDEEIDIQNAYLSKCEMEKKVLNVLLSLAFIPNMDVYRHFQGLINKLSKLAEKIYNILKNGIINMKKEIARLTK